MARGGKRNGAGRKKKATPSVTIRVPVSKKEMIKEWIETGDLLESQSREISDRTTKAISILERALGLKANAGGRIKTEIRQVITILQEKN